MYRALPNRTGPLQAEAEIELEIELRPKPKSELGESKSNRTEPNRNRRGEPRNWTNWPNAPVMMYGNPIGPSICLECFRQIFNFPPAKTLHFVQLSHCLPKLFGGNFFKGLWALSLQGRRHEAIA